MRPTDRAILKCDLCEERQATGRGPACVDACPTKALRYRAVEEETQDKRRRVIREFLKTQPTPEAR
jgi:carbon-monoxide dehydrogenase iron sulfur subunit